jgi:hypothetical protein
MKASKCKVAGAAFAALLVTLVLAAGASANLPSGIVIPAGDVATLSSATFGDQIIDPGNCPANTLAYGYELNAGANVQLASQAGCGAVSGATIGPFTTPTQLRIFLDDTSCGNTYYSDGSGAANHALVSASNAWTWTVSIMDSDSACVSGGVARVPVAPGTGNLNVTVTLTRATAAAVCATTRTLVHGSAAYTGGSAAWKVYADLLVSDACGDMIGIEGLPGSLQAVKINIYEAYTQVFAADGFLTSTQEAFLNSAASAL